MTMLAAPLSAFLREHLPRERKASPHTCEAYAYAFQLLVRFAAGRPDLWLHGHVHARRDHRIGPTRILCNPLGYDGENPAFDPACVVEVPS